MRMMANYILPLWGARGRRFKSSRPDQLNQRVARVVKLETV